MPTPTGWRLLTLGVVTAIGGRALGLLEFHVVGASAATAVLLALLVRLVHPSRLAVERRASASMVAVSEHVTVGLNIVNRSRVRSPIVRIRESASDGSESQFVLASLPAGASATASYRRVATRRGVLEIGPARLDDIDGLGLARRRHLVAGPTSVIVHPPIEDLRRSRVPASRDLTVPSEFTRRSFGLSGDDFDILRPYVSGDDPRHIHWRSTARFGDLMVRRFQPARPGRLAVVIDTRPPGDAERAQDMTTSVAASIVSAVLAAGDETRVTTTDGRGTPLLSQIAQIGEALEFLALLVGGSPDIDLSPARDGSVVVAVSAAPEAVDAVEARIHLAQRLRADLVITCGTGHDTSREPGADPSGGWIHLTGPGQLAGLWQMPVSAHRARAAAR